MTLNWNAKVSKADKQFAKRTGCCPLCGRRLTVDYEKNADLCLWGCGKFKLPLEWRC
jgi:hypothetical protein